MKTNTTQDETKTPATNGISPDNPYGVDASGAEYKDGKADYDEPDNGEEKEDENGLIRLVRLLDADNALDLLDDAEIAMIGQRTMQEYDIDKTSLNDWTEKNKKAMDMAMQVKEAKTFPWQGASNVKYPLITVAAVQFSARTYPAIMAEQRVVKGKVNGDDSGMYQVQLDQNGQPAIDPNTGEPIKQEILPAGIKQQKADRISTHMSWQLTEEMEEWPEEMDRLLMTLPIVGTSFKKTYFDPTLGRNVSETIYPENLVINYKAKTLKTAPRITQRVFLYPYEYEERVRTGMYRPIKGLQSSEEDPDAAMEFLEQHRREDLDGDGYSEPYIVVVHKDSGQVVRIVACFDEDDISLNDDGVSAIARCEYFTKYGFIPNPDSGVYDLGFGHLLYSLSSSVDSIINQMIDAGTVQNAGGGFVGDGLKIRGGNLRFKVGEYKRVDVKGGKIADNIYQMQHPGASQTLFSLLSFLVESSKDISSTKDILSGEHQNANIPATTTLAMIEQGLKSYTAIFTRVHRSLKSEMKKIFTLNRKYLEDEHYFAFLDEDGVIAREDYSDKEMDVTPVTDVNVVTDMQETARANFLMQFAGDPFIDPKEVRRRVLKAAKIPDTDALLVDPPQPPPPAPDPRLIKVESESRIAIMKEQRERVNDMISNLKTIAETESIEAGEQLGLYISQLEQVMGEINEQQQQAAQPAQPQPDLGAGLGGVEGQPDLGAILPVSGGQPNPFA